MPFHERLRWRHGSPVCSITERMFPAGSLKPGNGGTISTHNAFLVCLETGQIIDLEADPSPRQFIDRKIDISAPENSEP